MAEKNIEMNIKNQENNYETLYPKTKQELVVDLLNDDTKVYIGLSEDATADDAFRSLYLLNILNDKSAFKLTVKTQNNKAVLSNIQVESTSFIDSKGNSVSGPLLTNEKGEINTFFKGGSITLKISGYADLEDWQQSYEVVNGKQYEYEALLTTANFKKWTSSEEITFSENVSTIDVTCVGGGGGGSLIGLGSVDGGAGGYCTVQEEVPFLKNNKYSIIIGAGGRGGYGSSSSSSSNNGQTGGTTSFLGIESKGGNGGICDARTPAIGNGNGASGIKMGSLLPATEGTINGYSSFFDTIIYGGGGMGGWAYEGDGYYALQKAAGAGYGAKNEGANGSNGFGGGGGGKIANYGGDKGGAGGSGCVAIRMHLKNI